MTPHRHDIRDIPLLMRSLRTHAAGLMQTEAALARAEMRQGLSRATTGLAMIIVAALVGLTALNALAALAAIGLVALGLSWLAAAAIVTGAFVVIACVCALIGKAKLSPDKLVPHQTIRHLKSDFATLKEAARDPQY